MRVGAVVVGNTEHRCPPTSQIVAVTKAHESTRRLEEPVIKDVAHNVTVADISRAIIRFITITPDTSVTGFNIGNNVREDAG